jgi:hypothetical protein
MLAARSGGRDVTVDMMENASTTERECDDIMVMLIAAAAAAAVAIRDLLLRLVCD